MTFRSGLTEGDAMTMSDRAYGDAMPNGLLHVAGEFTAQGLMGDPFFERSVTAALGAADRVRR